MWRLPHTASKLISTKADIMEHIAWHRDCMVEGGGWRAGEGGRVQCSVFKFNWPVSRGDLSPRDSELNINRISSNDIVDMTGIYFIRSDIF